VTLALVDVDGNRIGSSATPHGVGGVVMTFICSVSVAVRMALVVLSIGVMAGIYFGALLAQG
jgi:ABC-type phosphate transport system permease subunit